jgi:hypothetical protein
MFKLNPKAQVVLKFQELFGRGIKPTVTGERLSPLACKAHGFPTDSYWTELRVGPKVLATARHRDWRKAYKLLALEVEKLYADGATLQ